jgi:hypothetical protein
LLDCDDHRHGVIRQPAGNERALIPRPVANPPPGDRTLARLSAVAYWPPRHVDTSRWRFFESARRNHDVPPSQRSPAPSPTLASGEFCCAGLREGIDTRQDEIEPAF